MAPAETGATFVVSVAYSPRAGVVDEVEVRVAEGATLADALKASGLLERHPQVGLDGQRFGIWGRPCDAATPLRARDRVEVYRPLVIDPMQARRERQRRQGGTAGHRR
jgi:putative ubiquitin-RnfH superfamily antitoxin RatB of RatAB toxin-antitoxin module